MTTQEHRPLGLAVQRYAQASPDYCDKLAETQAVLVRAATDYSPVTQASSLGVEDQVLSHLIGKLGLDIPMFVLDTGLLHAQTLDLLEQTRESKPVKVYRPESQSLLDFLRREGDTAMYRSVALRKACCALRKLEPLERALVGARAWVTGLRREQSDIRAQVPLVDAGDETSSGRTKFNPLALWTWGDVWHYIGSEGVDYNRLHDEFYPSIGCAPCTRAISLGEDLRAGRWWWEQGPSKECGLHTQELTQS
jgi:phosphoadenosine phosphosulfate reductase